MSHFIADRARQAIHQHDPSASVEYADGALQVDSLLPAATLVNILRKHGIATAESGRGECGCA
jgi:hypothetical protein